MKIKSPTKTALTLLLCATLPTITFADTIVAKMTFTKKPPRAGVLFAADGNQQPVKSEVVDQSNKQFDDHIYVISPGAEITFKNSDTMDHNIFSRGDDKAPGFDIGLIPPKGEKSQSLAWGISAFERLGCKIHPKMRAYMASVPNDAYLAIPFKQAGLAESYSLAVDDSTTKVGLLLSGYPPIEVAVAKGDSVEVEITKRDKVRGKLTISRTD